MPVKYIKGYKVDLKKLTERFGAPKDDPHNMIFLSVVELFPRGAYKYVGGGFEEDGSLSLVMVLDDGDDKAKLENSPMPEFNQMGLEATLTAGVWKNF
jgi:hypothetical protein